MATTKIIYKDNHYIAQIKTKVETIEIPVGRSLCVEMSQEDLFSLINSRKIFEEFELLIKAVKGNRYIVIFERAENE